MIFYYNLRVTCAGLATDPKISFVGIKALQRALGKSLPCLVDAPTGMNAQRINTSAFKLQVRGHKLLF